MHLVLEQTAMPAKKVYCENNAITDELKNLQRSGVIELIHYPYDDPSSRTRHISRSAVPSAKRWCDANMKWNEAVDVKWSDSKGSEKYEEILSLIGKNNRRDALHVDSAFKSKCACLVTCDKDILAHRDRLAEMLGIRFFDPARDRGPMLVFLNS
jgi:hypothetical protein